MGEEPPRPLARPRELLSSFVLGSCTVPYFPFGLHLVLPLPFVAAASWAAE
ncbi:hypothetical protein SEVIR_4G187000v4 [Setaria viridis]